MLLRFVLGAPGSLVGGVLGHLPPSSLTVLWTYLAGMSGVALTAAGAVRASRRPAVILLRDL